MSERIRLAGRMSFPLIEVAIEAQCADDGGRLAAALDALTAEDELFTVSIDEESGQTVLGGDNEGQLDEKIDRLRRLGLDFSVGAPQVAYRETLGCAAIIDSTFSRQAGAAGGFARVVIRFNPGSQDSGFHFQSEAPATSVPAEYLPGVEAGLQAARARGLLAGFPVIDFTATLLDGAYRDIDSSARAFEAAAAGAFQKLREKAEPLLLEPVMMVEVATPPEYMGDVMGDLNSRRGQLRGTEQRGGDEVITALVPLSIMFGYAPLLRAFTQGRGRFAMRYDHYAPIPQAVPDGDPRFPPAIGMRA